jgi:hypothetical protein
MRKKLQLKVRRPPALRAPGDESQAVGRVPALIERILYQSHGGTGLRTATHLKAIAALQGQRAAFLHKDSDHGDRYATTLPDGTEVRLGEDEMCLFGMDDPRGQLRNHPDLARSYERLLRGNTVALTYKRGAAQCRPIGLLQYELNIALVREATSRALDRFYPRALTRSAGLAHVQQRRHDEAQSEAPLLVVHTAGLCGGQGSSTVVADAYLTRFLLDRRKARNVTHLGVLLGPQAFRHRGTAEHNYAAVMRELEKVYRDGWERPLVTGETIAYAVPPFDFLAQIDLPEWPEGEDPDGPLSDSAMDDWLRQVALSVNLLTQRAMHDRLQSLLLNVSGDDVNGLALSTAQAALLHVNLDAIEEYVAVDTAAAALRALADRCAEA